MVDALSALEHKVINGSTQTINKNVYLGDIVRDLINSSVVGTPTNAKAATATITFGGAAIDGDVITIGKDVYEFVADDALSVTTPGNIPVDISHNTARSTNTITIAVQPTAGDKVTIGTKVYTFVPVGTDTADAEISIGSTVLEAQTNFVAAVNGTDAFNIAHPHVEAGAFNANISTISALVGGSAGDAIVTTETFTSGSNVFSAGTLLDGADCLPADAVTAIVTAINDLGTELVTAADGNGDTVVLTSAIGAAANSISVGFNVGGVTSTTTFAGGADGTISPGLAFMVDATNLYVSIKANTITGTNWRKIALSAL